MKIEKIILPAYTAIAVLFLYSCTDKGTQLRRHYHESAFEYAGSHFSGSPKEKAGYIDSIYNTFSKISAADKCRYWLFRSQLNAGSLPVSSIDTARINYPDSIISIIENEKLTNELPSEYANALNLKAESCLAADKYGEAIKAAALCKYICERSGDSCAASDNAGMLGLIAYRQEQYADAVRYFSNALSLSRSCGGDREQYYRTQKQLNNLGLSYRESEKPDSAVKYFRKGIAYLLQGNRRFADDSIFYYTALRDGYRNLASVFTRQNENDSSISFLIQSSLINTDNLSDHAAAAADTVFIANNLIKKKDTVAAIKLLDIVTPAYDHLGKAAQMQYMASMKQKYKAEKNPEQEIFYVRKLHFFKDSADKADKAIFKDDPQLMYEQAEKKYKIESLEENSRIQNIYTGASVLIGLLFIWLCFTVYKGFRRSRKNAAQMNVMNSELQKRESELELLMDEQEKRKAKEQADELRLQEMQLQVAHNNAILEQRRKIAADMHDELSSSLAALKYYVADVRDKSSNPDSKAVLSGLAEEVSSIYADARAYMHNLREDKRAPEYDIVSFLHDLSRKFREKKMISIHAGMDEEEIRAQLVFEQQNQLYHAIRECISNIIKHAQATAINIEIRMSGHQCRFSVADNGKGFDESIVKRGLGLNSIRARIEGLSGSIRFSTGKGGTTVEGSFPVE